MIEAYGIKPKHISILTDSRLEPGTTVTVRVMEDLGGGRFSLLVKGRTLTAESHLKLRPDQVIRAAVEHINGIWRLKVLPHNITPSAHGSRTALSDPQLLLYASVLRSGSGLPEESEASRRSTLLSRTRGRRLRIARIYAELLNRGVDPSAAFLEHFESLLFGRQSGNPNRQAPRHWPDPPNGSELKEDVDSEKNQDTLSEIFSRVADRNGHWSIRCFRRQLGNSVLDMVVKYRHYGKPALALTIHDSGRIFDFLMEDLEPIRLSVFIDDMSKIENSQWEDFRHRLSMIKVSINDKLQPLEESDGFTAGAMEVLAELEERI